MYASLHESGISFANKPLAEITDLDREQRAVDAQTNMRLRVRPLQIRFTPCAYA
jgi:hypothetical protein